MSKQYEVQVSVEAFCNFIVDAESVDEAKNVAARLAGEQIEIVFDSECMSPHSEVMAIGDDAVEEWQE